MFKGMSMNYSFKKFFTLIVLKWLLEFRIIVNYNSLTKIENTFNPLYNVQTVDRCRIQYSKIIQNSITLGLNERRSMLSQKTRVLTMTSCKISEKRVMALFSYSGNHEQRLSFADDVSHCSPRSIQQEIGFHRKVL